MHRILLFSLFLHAYTLTFAQSRYYVSQNATGGAQTGANWTDAFSGLQAALTVATPGDTIWVAAGVYTPTSTTDRTLSFTLVDGVRLYGGFSGSETALADRNIEQNQTILSGDIGVPGLRTDNSYHVVRGKGLGSATLVDGFYIRDGYSYNDFTPAVLDRYGAGMLLEGAPGVADSRPVIQNCFFENNNGNEGGGLCITWTDLSTNPQGYYPVNPVLRNCTFHRNTAANNGGALYKNSQPVSDTFIIEDCKFLNNKAFAGQGGGIYLNSTANSNTIIRRCLFERDTSWANAGGGISFYVGPPDKNIHSLLLDSCIFRQNLALEGGAFLYDAYTELGNSATFICQILNCQFDGNVARTIDGSAFYMLAGDSSLLSVEVEDCLFKDNMASNITTVIGFYQHNKSYLKMNRCIFDYNVDRAGSNRLCMAVNHGGNAFNTVTTEITNCLFYHNGGGVSGTSGAKNYSTTRISNCTFFENNEYIFVKTWDTIFNQPNGYYNDFFIDNCIVWEPGTDLRKMFYNNEPLISNMNGYRINHTLLSLSDSTSVPGASVAFQQALIWGQFPGFQDSLANDFRLTTCSPAVNRGNNNVVFDAGLSDDLDILPRIRYGTVDLGAYEQQDSCLSVHTSTPLEAKELVLWPNPSPDGNLSFQLPFSNKELGKVSVLDAQGREVYRTERFLFSSNSLHLENLLPGLYIIRLSTKDRYFLGKWLRI